MSFFFLIITYLREKILTKYQLLHDINFHVEEDKWEEEIIADISVEKYLYITYCYCKVTKMFQVNSFKILKSFKDYKLYGKRRIS